MDSEALTPYRLRTVRIGVQTTMMLVAALAAFRLLPGHGSVATTTFAVVLVCAALGAAGISALPWPRMFTSARGLYAMYAWSAADIVLITILASATGGPRSEMFLLYAFTTVFFSMVYPIAGQCALLGFTFACYLTLAALDGRNVGAASVALRMGVLGILAYFASFLSRELREQVVGQRAERTESEKRANLLAIVAAAARSMTTLDPEAVLGVIVASAEAIGFDVISFCLVDHSTRTYTISHGRGLPEVFDSSPLPVDAGLPGLVLAAERTVRLGGFGFGRPSHQVLQDAGVAGAIGVPVWSRGEIAGVLAAGSRAERPIADQEMEALELLAQQAGRTLDNVRLFEEERAAVERLAQIDKLKDDFVSTVSHELRTPLTAIEGMGITLEHRWDDLRDDQRRALVERMNANSKALDTVIGTLLDFSRLEAGHVSVNAETLQFEELLRRVAMRMAPVLADHSFSAIIDDDLVVYADPALMERVVENLLSNATKHTPAGTRVSLTARLAGDAVEVRLADHGPGIPASDLPHIGERFYRSSHTSRAHTRGTGLGLALVREILEMHGAELRVVSEPGGGAEFVFALPLAEPRAHAV
jgi:K+-sensing histidine kinase KdpD